MADLLKSFNSPTVGLVLPGLLSVPKAWLQHQLPAVSRQVTELERFLSLSALQQSLDTDSLHLLAHLFGLDVTQMDDVPVAALQNREMLQDEWVMYATPVHLYADRAGLVLIPLEDVESLEARGLIDVIQQHFNGEPWRLDYQTPGQWLIHSDNTPHVQTTALEAVAHRDITGKLPAGADGRYWRAMQNEMQMLLHNHPINLAREQDGRLPINGVWLWGSGRAPTHGSCSWTRMMTNSFSAQALCHGLGVECLPLERFNLTMLQRGNTLVLDKRCDEALRAGDLAAWQAELVRMNREYFQPLLLWLRQQRSHQLVVWDGIGRVFQLDGRGVNRWWRRTKPVVNWCSEEGV